MGGFDGGRRAGLTFTLASSLATSSDAARFRRPPSISWRHMHLLPF